MSWRAGSILGKCVKVQCFAKILFRYLDIKDSLEFQRYTSTCHTHKEVADGVDQELGKEMEMVEVKEEEVEEENRQHGRVRRSPSRLEICRDHHDRRSCKFFSSCVNFSR